MLLHHRTLSELSAQVTRRESMYSFLVLTGTVGLCFWGFKGAEATKLPSAFHEMASNRSLLTLPSSLQSALARRCRRWWGRAAASEQSGCLLPFRDALVAQPLVKMNSPPPVSARPTSTSSSQKPNR
jgi:hypothetical protein